MLRSGALFAATAMGFAAHAQAPAQQPGDVLAALVGSCWRTQMDNKGPDTDTHCFEEAVGGQMVTDTHKVRNPKGEVVYEGVSVYMLDKPSGALKYEYFYSTGGKLIGYGWRAGDEIRFGSKPGQEKPDLTWSIGKDSYTVIPASPELGHPGTFARVPAGQ
ncbi:MAG TPA: hypothetical protein VIA80_12300 [Hyphomonadaceae bacterium]|jgi:hypothetical protein